MAEGAQTGKDDDKPKHGDDSAPPTLVEGEAPGSLRSDAEQSNERDEPVRSHTTRAEQEFEPKPIRPEPTIHKDNDTHTQPSLSALSDRPPPSLDLRRVWRIEEQFDRHDARIRLLEKELSKTRLLAGFALTLVALLALLWFLRG